MKVGDVFRRIAAANLAAGDAAMSSHYGQLATDADTSRADSDDDVQLLGALHSEIGAANRRANAAKARADVDAERREHAVRDRALDDIKSLRARADSSTRTDAAPAPAVPTPTDLRTAQVGVRWRTDLDDAKRSELAQSNAREAAELRAERERRTRPRVDASDADRADADKISVALSALRKLAGEVAKMIDVFDRAGDAARTTRLRAIVSELETFAEPSRADDRRDAWKLPLPNTQPDRG